MGGESGVEHHTMLAPRKSPGGLGRDFESECEAVEAPQLRMVRAMCKANLPAQKQLTKHGASPKVLVSLALRGEAVVLMGNLLGRRPSRRQECPGPEARAQAMSPTHRPRPRRRCRGVVVAREPSWQGSSGGTSEGAVVAAVAAAVGERTICTTCARCALLGFVRRFRDSRPKPSNAIDGHMGTVLDGCCPSRLPSVLWLRLSCQRHGYGSRTTDPSGPYCTVTVRIPTNQTIVGHHPNLRETTIQRSSTPQDPLRNRCLVHPAHARERKAQAKRFR
jgi:hypothetical protein